MELGFGEGSIPAIRCEMRFAGLEPLLPESRSAAEGSSAEQPPMARLTRIAENRSVPKGVL